MIVPRSIAMPADRTPPDIDTLPPLPPRFSWQLPHAKQLRRPCPESRQIEVDGEGPALASMTPSVSFATTLIGIHRALQGGRHERTFATRETALRYLAAWAWKYADQLMLEIEQRRSTGYR